jgi:tRNA(Arg) A34 adenosine deaminase TadA
MTRRADKRSRGVPRFPRLALRLPDWVETALPDRSQVYATVEERMAAVIRLALLNIERGTGGPFGAAIFDQDAGTLLAPGVNLVVPSSCSVAHAEMVAIAIAQRMIGCYDLGGQGMPRYELVTSTEPCAMCLGAVTWSGVRRLVCGARDEDARRVGFDEGIKAADWRQALDARGISVLVDVCREQAVAVLDRYGWTGGLIYNARQGR